MERTCSGCHYIRNRKVTEECPNKSKCGYYRQETEGNMYHYVAEFRSCEKWKEDTGKVVENGQIRTAQNRANRKKVLLGNALANLRTPPKTEASMRIDYDEIYRARVERYHRFISDPQREYLLAYCTYSELVGIEVLRMAIEMIEPVLKSENMIRFATKKVWKKFRPKWESYLKLVYDTCYGENGRVKCIRVISDPIAVDIQKLFFAITTEFDKKFIAHSRSIAVVATATAIADLCIARHGDREKQVQEHDPKMEYAEYMKLDDIYNILVELYKTLYTGSEKIDMNNVASVTGGLKVIDNKAMNQLAINEVINSVNAYIEAKEEAVKAKEREARKAQRKAEAKEKRRERKKLRKQMKLIGE